MSIRRLATTILLLLLFSTATLAGEEERYYTAYNMWYGSLNNINSLNLQVGTLLPAGTEVKEFGIRKPIQPGVGMPVWGNAVDEAEGIVFTTMTGKTLEVEFTSKYHPALTQVTYLQRMFSTKSFSQLTDGFSAEEVEAIRRGAVIVGMPKQAVLVSYGFPPEHTTPNHSLQSWRYWINRFKSKNICFDEVDRAIACEDLRKKDL